MTPVLAMITANFVADFMLQSGFQEQRQRSGLLVHMLLVSVVTAVVLSSMGHSGLFVVPSRLAMVLFCTLVGFFHVSQDVIASSLYQRWGKSLSELSFLALDQGLHLLILVGTTRLLVQQQVVVATTSTSMQLSSRLDAALCAILLSSLGIGVAAVLIAYLLAPFEERLSVDGRDQHLPQAGLWIGVCERFLLILAIAAGSDVFPSVGLLMTGKSIFRFRELDNRAHAEYYLLGSLLSICIAVLVGLALRSVLPEIWAQQLR
jgi:hypothetical protein